jgi:hypothetical protein
LASKEPRLEQVPVPSTVHRLKQATIKAEKQNPTYDISDQRFCVLSWPILHQ